MSTQVWYEDSRNIADLIRWLSENDHETEPQDIGDIIAMLDKPWHYTPEWEEMSAELEEASKRVTSKMEAAEAIEEVEPA